MGANLGSDFLFPAPSPLYGVARLMDLGANLDSYNEVTTPEQADRLAIMMDWYVVGLDLKRSVDRFVQEQETVPA